MKQEDLWANALSLMPRGTQTMSKCPDQFVDGVYPKFAARAEGAYIWDHKGNKYLDFMCGLGPIILGYNHKPTNISHVFSYTSHMVKRHVVTHRKLPQYF